MAHVLNIASTTKTFKVAVVGVGLVGGEFIRQLLAFPSPSPFRLVSLSSSKSTVFAPDGLSVSASNWTDELASSGRKPDLQFLLRELASLVKPGQEVVLVDNTSSNDVAALYPQFLKVGVNVITPNKKAFSSELSLYEQILAASLESGAKFLNEATVGAGLPIISTLKDLIATGDKVRTMCNRSCVHRLTKFILTDHQDRGCVLGHDELYLQRVLHWKGGRSELLICCEHRPREGLHGAFFAMILSTASLGPLRRNLIQPTT